eukprot:TRINITY_DN23022_c0_g1_i1.p1 TRINITY_DN23022_c0_g1~~TRINITY_DN23022_c0_g1_i1.p1  ORF type:complete len:346 (-),score=37.81 TRINITY_DN23022_c0_g1_i1:264-1301(-)
MSESASGERGRQRHRQRHWCHECNSVITAIGRGEELLCPQCHGGFVEELELEAQEEHPRPLFHGFDVWEGVRSQNQAGDSAPPRIVIGGGGEEAIGRIINSLVSFFEQRGTSPEEMLFVNHMQNLVGGQNNPNANANIQLVFDHNLGTEDYRIGGGQSFGDYFMGPGLENLIQQLMENDPNRYGSPPTAKSAIEEMPMVKITQAHLSSDEAASCAVCKDTFQEGAAARQMPCKHTYHSDCIVPWLELHSTCPVCRYQMPSAEDHHQNSGNPNPNPSIQSPTPQSPGSPGESSLLRRLREQLPRIYNRLPATQGGSSSGQGSSGRDHDEDLSRDSSANNDDPSPSQ